MAENESWFIAGIRMSESEFRAVLCPDCLGGSDTRAWDAYESKYGCEPTAWKTSTEKLCTPEVMGKERLCGDILKLWAYAYFHFGNGYRGYKKPLEKVVFSRTQYGHASKPDTPASGVFCEMRLNGVRLASAIIVLV